MSSVESSWRHLLRSLFPFLFKKCSFGNFHWRWDRYCFCGRGTYSSEWHGGVFDFRLRREIWSAPELAAFFLWELEKYHPLKDYWEKANSLSEGENYPYSYFKQEALKRLIHLLREHCGDLTFSLESDLQD